MARPRVFVSSTYYDLKYVRSSLEVFIESMGYDSVLSEKGAVAFNPDIPLDESCYREVQNSDMYVLIVGGRYGSEATDNRSGGEKAFYDRYESITKQEYKAAIGRDIPVYVLIERSVYAEYFTFQKNRSRDGVAYAHVDSVNVFHFIDEIMGQPLNSPIQPFEKYSDIEGWLRVQWAGLFRDMLAQRSSQRQLASLAAQVGEMREVNTTLRRYLEELMAKLSPGEESAKIIRSESERLTEARQKSLVETNNFSTFAASLGIDTSDLILALKASRTIQEFADALRSLDYASEDVDLVIGTLNVSAAAQNDADKIRGLLGLPLFTSYGPEPASPTWSKRIPRRTKSRPQEVE